MINPACTGSTQFGLTLLLGVMALGACPLESSTSHDGDVEAATKGDATSPVTPETSDATVPAALPQTPPTSLTALDEWLAAEHYLEWLAEPQPHPSQGPHFGQVRTFFNTALATSLQSNALVHPEGSAAVKELFGSDSSIQGYSVMLKVQADSANGAGWFFYEVYQGTTFANSAGAGTCAGCHSGGVDFIRTSLP